MKKMLKKIVAVILSLSLLFLLSAFTISAEDTERILEHNHIHQDYNSITNENVASQNAQTRSVSSTFSVATGGTMLYEYTGNYGLNVVVGYTRIIYMPVEVVSAVQTLVAVDGIEDSFASFLLDFGLDLITNPIVDAIATKYLLNSSLLGALIGFSVNLLIEVVENHVEWDLASALRDSTTGKLKYVSGFMYNPYEQIGIFYSNDFQPWNSNEVELFDNHEYMWLEDYYFESSSGSSDCTHTYTTQAKSQREQGHTTWCTQCGYINLEPHTDFEYEAQGNSIHHIVGCTECEYTKTANHSFSGWTSLNASKHRRTCTICNFSITGFHTDSYDQLLGRCRLCGYVGQTQLNSVLGLEKIASKELKLYQ